MTERAAVARLIAGGDGRRYPDGAVIMDNAWAEYLEAADRILAAGYTRGDSAAMREAEALIADRLADEKTALVDAGKAGMAKLSNKFNALPASGPVAAPVETQPGSPHFDGADAWNAYTPVAAPVVTDAEFLGALDDVCTRILSGAAASETPLPEPVAAPVVTEAMAWDVARRLFGDDPSRPDYNDFSCVRAALEAALTP